MNHRGISDETWDGYLRAWNDFTDNLTFHRVAGDHFTILDEGDNVAVFERALNGVLNERGL